MSKRRGQGKAKDSTALSAPEILTAHRAGETMTPSTRAELRKYIRKQAVVVSEVARGLLHVEQKLADGCSMAQARALMLKLKLSSKASQLSRFAGSWK